MTDTLNEPTLRPPPPPPGTRPSRDVREGPLPIIVSIAALVALGLLASWWVVAVVLAIVVMIFLHELGHYLTAKWGGMKVTEFFIGFGPRLWSLRRGETVYGLKAIPFGAYVKIIGMHNLEEVPPEDEPRTYRQATFPRRFAVGVAGSSMHFLQAFVLLMVLYAGFGVPDRGDWTVREVLPASAAEALGMQPGDRPLSINGTPVADFEELGDQLADLGGKPITVTFEREGQVLTGEAIASDRLTSQAARDIDGSGGLVARDRIVTLDGQPVQSYADFASRVSVGSTHTVEVARSNNLCTVDVTVEALPPADGATTGFLGLQAEYGRDRLDPFTAAGRSAGDFGRVTGGAVSGIVRFFAPSNVGGFVSDAFQAADDDGSGNPASCRVLTEDDDNRILSIVGLGRIATEAGNNGVDQFIEMFALFNIFIGVFNLLPLLPFDGGHVVIATYERLRSRPGRRYHADVTKLLPITYAVTLVFITLGLLALYFDINQPPSIGG